MTASFLSTGVTDASFGFAAHLQGDLRQAAHFSKLLLCPLPSYGWCDNEMKQCMQSPQHWACSEQLLNKQFLLLLQQDHSLL